MCCQATVNSMNITEDDWAFQSIWSDFNAAFVGTSDETQGTVKKLIDFSSSFQFEGIQYQADLEWKGKWIGKVGQGREEDGGWWDAGGSGHWAEGQGWALQGLVQEEAKPGCNEDSFESPFSLNASLCGHGLVQQPVCICCTCSVAACAAC